MVDAAGSMATSSEQLASTARSLEDGLGQAAKGAGTPTILREPLQALAALNGELRDTLHRLRDELGTLFTTGSSQQLRPLLRDLAKLPSAKTSELSAARAQAAEWAKQCSAPGALARYGHFETLHSEHRALEAELRGLGDEVYLLREERASADGTLAGLEERLSKRRARRNGEEYELARYLGSSLFRWDLLRTKVAHHLATTFSASREEALEGKAGEDIEGAEQRLGAIEERLQHVAEAHKRQSERRQDLGKQLRSFLKSLVRSCEAVAGSLASAAGEAIGPRKYQLLGGKGLGVYAQAGEEFSRFLNATFEQSLPQTVALLEEVLQPYVVIGDENELILPTTWKARPKVGRWWEWLEEVGGRPVAQEEFERRFAAAKRRFSVRVSAAEPVVMAYLLWLILEDVLSVQTREGHQEVVLSLPSPDDASPYLRNESESAAVPVVRDETSLV